MSSEPRLAAACIIIRGDETPEVLLAQRNTSLRFMAGHYVFPGGRIQDDEDISRVQGAADETQAKAIFAVVREVFEETGLLCVEGELPEASLLRDARQRLLREELSLSDFLGEHALTIEAGRFQPAGEWLTPPFVPIRFATQYYLYRISDRQCEELIEGEIIALDWLTAARARERWLAREIRLSTPVAYTLRHLAAAPVETALDRLRRGTEREPGEHNWFEIRRGITLIPVKSATIPPATRTNCIIVGEKSLYVIDPGAQGAAEQQHLTRQIDHLLELGGKVNSILLTHSHPDHTEAAELLRERYQAPIMAHEAVVGQVPFAIDHYLRDGDELECADDSQWRLQCIHTPGHDPSHLCFLEQSTGALLAGDMVANPGTILVSRAYAGDMAHFMQSLERLLEFECKLIVPAHGQPAAQPHEFIQLQLNHRRWREAKIQAAYDAGATTFDELLVKAYDDASPAALPWARHSLDAHLAKLGIELPVDL